MKRNWLPLGMVVVLWNIATVLAAAPGPPTTAGRATAGQGQPSSVRPAAPRVTADCQVPAWGMPEGRFRRAITLNPPTARPDAVVLIVLNTRALGRPYGHVHPDGSDLRLTGADRKAPLGYWIEHWDSHGDSRIWVRVPGQGTDRLWLYYGNAQARAASDGAAVFDFFDDFNDGLWTKHPGNPVLTSSEPWEARAICEPSVIVEDGRWRMWYMGCKTSTGTNAALGYATSPDGLAWTKHPGNPILRDPEQAVIRTTVLKHRGTART